MLVHRRHCSPAQLPIRNGSSGSDGSEPGAPAPREGVLFGWGRNDYGQLGTGDREPRIAPAQIFVRDISGALEHITDACAGEFHSVVVAKTGLIYVMGANIFGVLGIGGSTSIIKTKPVALEASARSSPLHPTCLRLPS